MGNQASLPTAGVSGDQGLKVGTPCAQLPFISSRLQQSHCCVTFGTLLDLSDLSLLICNMRIIVTSDVLSYCEAQIAETCVNI